MSLKTRWWSKSRGLPAGAYASLVASLRADGQPVERILSWATTGDGFCIGFPALLSYGNEDGWTHVGWHEIESGGWNSETRRISFRAYDGRRGLIDLAEPARLPELFRERVAASLVVEKFIPVDGNRGVTISGRRDLADAAAPIAWHSTLTRGVTWQTEGIRDLADRALEQVRTEYDIR
ncbi:hypothetical protein [Microlunatus sp. GCM10028923]|uniref:hypothetical protein n=1 Tax=Microlunatus sp. GCM10028923 TaxID=3273400 RepID=UPI00361E1F3C